MEQIDYIVRSGILITGYDKPVIQDGAVAVSENLIAAFGTYSEINKRFPNSKEVGGPQFCMIPGLINGHSHGRGLSDFQRGGLDNTLETWRLNPFKYTPIPTYEDVAFSAIRMLKSGVTATMHNHLLRRDLSKYESEFRDALRAYTDVGMRVLFCPGIRDDNPFIYGDNGAFESGLPERLRRYSTLEPPSVNSLNAQNYINIVRGLFAEYNGPMIRIGFGPVAPQWCTADLLRVIRRESEKLNTPLHIHVLQTIFQKIYGLQFLGKTLIKYMDDLGLLGRGVVLGHCVFPTESDVEILVKTETGVTHHPSCNLRERNGIAPAFHMLKAGVTVGIGMDGKSINDDDDLLQEMRVCFLLHRLPSMEPDSPYLTARDVFRMVTENNSILIGYSRELGRIEKGRYADLVLLDYNKIIYPYVNSCHDPLEVLLYRARNSHVHTVIINGIKVLEEGRVLAVDEETISGRLAEAASKPPTNKELEYFKAIDELRSYIAHYYQGWTNRVALNPYFSFNSKEDGL